MPKQKNGYISLILPRDYLMELLPDLKTPSKHTHSKSEMVALFKLRDIREDLPRTPWKLGKDSKQEWFGTKLKGPESTPKEMSAEGNNFKLTYDEAAALSAFATSDGKGDALQGGFFRTPATLIPWWFHNVIGWRLTTVDSLQVTRNEKNNLIVLAEFNLSFKDETTTLSDVIIYANQYELQQTGNHFTLTHLNNPENKNILIEENFFNDYILNNSDGKGALQLLENTLFDAEDIEFFVPLLNHDDFFDQFFRKLQTTNISQANLSYLLQKIELCFKDDLELFHKIKLAILNNTKIASKSKLSFWQHHQWKIILPTISLIVLASVTTTIALLLGPIGGILLFAIVTAAISLTAVTAAMLVGAKIDQNNTFENLENLKALPQGNSEKELEISGEELDQKSSATSTDDDSNEAKLTDEESTDSEPVFKSVPTSESSSTLPSLTTTSEESKTPRQ